MSKDNANATDLQFGQLSDLLSKSHIIPTLSSERLKTSPGDAEHIYSIHARTHIPLGETTKLIGDVFKWVSENKGAFVGGVTGNYGEGKTSFLIHVWEKLSERNVMVAPPFSWRSISDIVDGVDAWVQHKMAKTHPQHMKRAHDVWERHRRHTIEEYSKQRSIETGVPVHDILKVVDAETVSLEVTAERLLGYCEALTAVLMDAGYRGLLVLLDEPEVTAKGGLSTSLVAQILFDLASGLMGREGNYGVFISAPDKFMAQANAAFPSLYVRLASRRCLISLGDLYNDDFAETLWSRYATTLSFEAKKHAILPRTTLLALGQIASSARRDLAFGPRTVITAFRRAVQLHMESGDPYSTVNLVDDMIDQEVIVKPEYTKRIKELMHQADIEDVGADNVRVLAAFPNGVRSVDLETLGLDATKILEHARPGSPILYRRSGLVGLKSLTREQGSSEMDLLKEHLVTIANQYSPQPAAFTKALDSIGRDILPLLFPQKQGQQLIGWKRESARLIEKDQLYLAEFIGAFDQTRAYPNRKAWVILSSLGVDTKRLLSKILQHGDEPDVVIHMRLKWQADVSSPVNEVHLEPGSLEEGAPALIVLELDLCGTVVELPQLVTYLEDESLLTPLFLLYAFDEMRTLTLGVHDEATWTTLRDAARPALLYAVLGSPDLRRELGNQVDSPVPGGLFELIPALMNSLFQKRMPEYSTLISQPQWQQKVQAYTNALSNSQIPLSARRGGGTWRAPKRDVASAFNTTAMNLDSWLSGLGSLISANTRTDPAEVDFRLHPMESRIQSIIMAQESGSRIKIDGKECWWVHLADVSHLLLTSGYHQEELAAIVAIGRARGTFDVEDVRGKPVLYCLPFDPDQMRAKLVEKASSLSEQAEAFRGIRKYEAPKILDTIDKRIESVSNELEFDALLNEMNRAFETDNARLDGFRKALYDALDIGKSHHFALHEQLRTFGQRELTSPPTSVSKWGSDLVQYVYSNLQRLNKELVADVSEALRQLQTVLDRNASDHSGSKLNQAARIAAGWDFHDELAANFDGLKSRAHVLKKQVDDYVEWRKVLLQRSDPLYNSLMSSMNEPENRQAASSFMISLESVWDQITDHLKATSVTSLGTYRQFDTQIADIEAERHTYQQTQKTHFEAAKKALNGVMEVANVSSRVTTSFNPSEVTATFKALYEEAASKVRQELAIELDALGQVRQEVAYSRDVLRRIESNAAEPLMTRLDDVMSAIEARDAALNAAWFEMIAQDAESVEASSLSAELASASKIGQDARKAIRESAPSVDGPSAVAAEVLALSANHRDLKGVILALIDDGKPADSALDSALVALGELFRSGRVNIKLEIPKP